MYWSHVWYKVTLLRFYKTLSRPVLCHGSETWTIHGKKTGNNRIPICEMKSTRRTAGYTKCDHKGNWDTLDTVFFFFPLASTVLIVPWPSLMDFSIHRHFVGFLGWGISPTQGIYRNRTQHRNTQTHVHAPSRTRTCYLNVQAVVDSTSLRPLRYWERHSKN
jgi:hypothetical protein